MKRNHEVRNCLKAKALEKNKDRTNSPGMEGIKLSNQGGKQAEVRADKCAKEGMLEE